MHSKDFKAGAPGAVRNSGPQEARVASGGCFLLVFAENVVKVVDFRLGRLENIAPVHKSKLRKRVDFYFGPGGPQEARVASGGCFLLVFW